VEHLLRSIIVFGLAAGTTTHVLMLLRLMPMPSAPAGYYWFWTALTFIDPLIAAAIVFAPRVGLAAAIVLMLSDVGVNVTASGGFDDWAIWLQSAFALFVLAATPYCWNRIGWRRATRSPSCHSCSLRSTIMKALRGKHWSCR
jgi:hypothetical protein